MQNNQKKNENDFSFSIKYRFSQEDYICKISTRKGTILVVEIEELETSERWKGEFSAKSIEAVTSKTGNYKKFSVFVKMLYSSFSQKSDSVTIDLLTRSQLELLFRKGKSKDNKETKKPENKSIHQQKYLILTYAVEFDRVHYPLPLAYQPPTVDRLQETVKRLRKVIKNISSSSQEEGKSNQITAPSTPGNGDGQRLIQELKMMEKENRKIRREKKSVEMEIERMRKESRIMEKEMEILGSDLEAQDIEFEKLKNKSQNVIRLEEEIERKNRILKKRNKVIKNQEYEIALLKETNKKLSLENRKLKREGNSQKPYNTIGGRRSSFKATSAGKKKILKSGKYSFSRFDPTEYVKKQKEKRRISITKKRRSSSRGRSNSRSRSAPFWRERSNSRGRARSKTRDSSRNSSRKRSRSNSKNSRRKSRSRSKELRRNSSVERKINHFKTKKKIKF